MHTGQLRTQATKKEDNFSFSQVAWEERGCMQECKNFELWPLTLLQLIYNGVDEHGRAQGRGFLLLF